MAGLFSDEPGYNPEDFQLGSVNASSPDLGVASSFTQGGTPSTIPPAPSRSWLSDIGLLLSATAGGAKGDFGVVERTLNDRQRRITQQQEMQNRTDQLALQKLALTPHLLDALSKTSQMISDPEQAKQVAPIFQKLFKDVAGIDYPAESFQGLLLDSGKADAVRQIYPELAKEMSPKVLLQLARDPAALDRVMKIKEQQKGDQAFETFQRLKEGGAIKPDVTLDQANQLLPDSKYWTDEQRLRLGFDTKATLEAAKKGEDKTNPDVRSVLSAGRMLTGKEINSVSELSAKEQQDVQLYAGIKEPAVKTAIDELRIKPENKGKSITDLYGEAVAMADKRTTGKAINVGVTIAGQAAEARANVAANAPIKPDKASNYVKITGESPQGDPGIKSVKDMTPDNLRAKGYRYLPEERLRGFHASQIALQQVDRIEKMGDKLFKGVAPGENLANAIKLRGKQILGDADVRAFEAIINETLPTNAVASGLTPGRVGENIIEKVERPVMPNMTDTQESFKKKVQNMKQRFANNMNVHFGLGIPANLVDEANTAAGNTPGQPEQKKLKFNPATGRVE